MGIKYAVNENFFDTWNQKMAYVLGYIYADGSLTNATYMRGKYISVTSIDEEIIIKIKKWLSSKHKIRTSESPWPGGHIRYLLRIGSHKLYTSLVSLGLYPNKSLTIGFPNIPQKYLGDFMRGYFDGDGCVFLERSKGKTQKLIVRRLSIIFTSGSKKFLKDMGSTLQKVSRLNHNKVYNSHRSFQLRYATADSIKLFKLLYKNTPRNCYLKRKTKNFLNYFHLRPVRVDREIENIIQLLK